MLEGYKINIASSYRRFSYDLIDTNYGDLFQIEKNELSNKFIEFLTKEKNEYTYKYLAAEFKCKFENA